MLPGLGGSVKCGEMFGGFAPLPWRKSARATCPESSATGVEKERCQSLRAIPEDANRLAEASVFFLSSSSSSGPWIVVAILVRPSTVFCACRVCIAIPVVRCKSL